MRKFNIYTGTNPSKLEYQFSVLDKKSEVEKIAISIMFSDYVELDQNKKGYLPFSHFLDKYAEEEPLERLALAQTDYLKHVLTMRNYDIIPTALDDIHQDDIIDYYIKEPVDLTHNLELE